MEKIFINHTNHPSDKWSIEQKLAAEKIGRIIDVPFPDVPPNFDTSEVHELVMKNLREIMKLSPAAVLCQGEFNYTVAMVEELKKNNVAVMAATSERVVSTIQESDGTTKRVSIFNFVRFRSY